MGVKDLWQVLAPVCERKSLWELQDKTVAIDLSGWVCDSQNVVEHSSQPNMHLRNLFFRTSCLLLLGARPVFVLEGDAPDLKRNVMTQRNVSRGLTQSKTNSGKRTRYKAIQKKCEEMLKCLGVQCVQSFGEAEALCALLNGKGMVDGCISQDSDCFLYGGRVVFRNFTISATSSGGGGPGFSIDMYQMKQVEELLGLSRTKLIGLSLLCGCDYNQGGVSGVGKETAVKFLTTLKDSEVFPRFFRWRNDPIYEQLEKERIHGVCDRCSHLGKRKLHDKEGCNLCGLIKGCNVNVDSNALIHRDLTEQKELIMELNIRKKALQDEHFPSQDVIEEFSSVRPVPEHLSVQWSQPNLVGFMKLAEKYLKWDECYSLEKFLPLVTRWLILQKKNTDKCPIYPESILKTRVLKGIASYEVKWSDREGLFDTLISEEDFHISLTIEPKDLFERAFPKLVVEFNEKEEAKKLSKKKGKSKATKNLKNAQVTYQCSNCGKDLPSKNQSCMCNFVTVPFNQINEKSSVSTLENLLDNLSLAKTSVAGDKKDASKLKSKPSKVRNNCEKLKKLLGNEDSDVFQNLIKTKNKKEEVIAHTSSGNPSKPSIKEAAKFSFESLLEDEEWSEADFVAEDSVDLSDIVQSITERSTNPAADCQVKASSLCVQNRVHVNCDLTDTHCNNSVKGPPEAQKNLQDDEFSDEEIPYTPLIDRVRKMQENRVNGTQTSVASLKLRRLSESFQAFCEGENATSSPSANNVDSLTSFNGSCDNTGVNFSLGLTHLLED